MFKIGQGAMFEIAKYILDLVIKIAPDISKFRQATRDDQIISGLIDILIGIDALACDAIRIDNAMVRIARPPLDCVAPAEAPLTLDQLRNLFELQVSRLDEIIKGLNKYWPHLVIADDALRTELLAIIDTKRGLLARYMRYAKVHGAQYSTLTIPAPDTLQVGGEASNDNNVLAWQQAVRAAPVLQLDMLAQPDALQGSEFRLRSSNTAALEQLRARLRQGIIEIFGRDRVAATLGRLGPT